MIALSICLSVALAALAAIKHRAAHPPLPWTLPASIEAGGSNAPKQAIITGREQIRAVIRILRTAKHELPFKCLGLTWLDLHYTDGTVVNVNLVDCAKANEYHIRVAGQYYTVPRDAFLQTMLEAGCDVGKLSPTLQ